MNYGLLEIVGLVSTMISIAAIAIKLYDNKIRTERSVEIEHFRHEWQHDRAELHETLVLQAQALEHDKHRTEEEMNRLAMNMNELTKSVTTLTESVGKLAVEVGVTKESVKSAHKRITEVQRYE